MSEGTPEGYFEHVGEGRYRPSLAVSGAWREDEQHFSPLGGLVVHAVEEYLARRPASGMVIGRIGFEILGMLALEPFDVHVETIRPGRTIELVEATVVIAGRPAVRARVWLLAEQGTKDVAGGAGPALPAPDTCPSQDLSSVWSGGYIASVDIRSAAPSVPGRGAAWVGSDLPLVAGETSSPLASFVALVDTANGIATRESPKEWLFPNVDLTIHLHRQPFGGWTGLDTTVIFGPSGQGITSTVLHDVDGPVGVAQQMLTVRPTNNA